jgi:hypothetical protein
MWAKLTQERKFALVWLVSEASYAEREHHGIRLRVGETPPVSLSSLEARFNWTKKTARVFLEYALSSKCAEETGIRVKRGQLVKGHHLGQGEGHHLGHTYIIGLVRLTDCEGHHLGQGEGHHLGQGIQEKSEEVSKNSLPTGEKKHTRPRGSRRIPETWTPDAELEVVLRAIAVQRGADYDEQMVMLRDHEFPRPYHDWSAVARNWFRNSRPKIGGTNGNGRNGNAGWGRREDWRNRREGESARDDPIFADTDDGGD